MKIFLDTNVVVDFCAKRKDFFKDAAQIIDMGISGDVEIVISSLTFINVAYIMRKAYDKELVFQKLYELSDICEIAEINGLIIRQSIKNKSRDFEDCVQCYSAKLADADLIITRDEKGFVDLSLPWMSPKEFIAHCQE